MKYRCMVSVKFRGRRKKEKKKDESFICVFSCFRQGSDLFDPRLLKNVIKMVDVSYGGEAGFNQAIELSAETLGSVKLVQVSQSCLAIGPEASGFGNAGARSVLMFGRPCCSIIDHAPSRGRAMFPTGLVNR